MIKEPDVSEVLLDARTFGRTEVVVSDLDADRRYYVTIRSRAVQNGDGGEQAPACTFTVTGVAIL